MAAHSSVLAWRIPGKVELDGRRLWGHTESDTTEATYLLPLPHGEFYASSSLWFGCLFFSEPERAFCAHVFHLGLDSLKGAFR